MNISIITHSSPPEWWDNEVETHEGPFTSSSGWDKFHSSLGIGRGNYFEIQIDGKRAALAFARDALIGENLLSPLPKILLLILSKIPFLRSYHMHMQPVIIDPSLKADEKKLEELSNKFLTFLLDKARKEKKNIMPADYICFGEYERAKSLKKSLGNATSLIGTSRLELTDNEEKMYQNFDESVKSGIRKCDKLGVKVREVGLSDLDYFYDGLRSGWNVHGLSVNPKKYYEELKKTDENNVKYFVAVDGSNVLAGSGIMRFGNTMMEFSMFVTPYARTNKIPGGDLVKWEIIKFGIRNKIKTLDLNMIGVSETEIDDKIKNINFYKLKWGGSIEYGITIVSLSPALKLIQKLKQNFLGH